MHLFHARFQTAGVFICKIIQQQHVENGLLMFSKVRCSPHFKRSWAVCWQHSLCPPRATGVTRGEERLGTPTGRKSRGTEAGCTGGPRGSREPRPGLRQAWPCPSGEEHAPENHPEVPHKARWTCGSLLGHRSLRFWKLTARLPGFVATTTITWAQMVAL